MAAPGLGTDPHCKWTYWLDLRTGAVEKWTEEVLRQLEARGSLGAGGSVPSRT